MKTKPSFLFPILLVTYEVATYLANDMYLPALPTMSQELGFTQHQAQLTFTAWFVGSMTMQLILGPLSDRYGRRPVMLGGCALFILATTICMLTHGITSFLIARFIQGCVISSIIVAGYASIHEIFDQKSAIRVLAIMGGVTVIAPAFGPLLGSLVLLLADWRWIFGLLLIWLSLTSLALYKWMPETNPPAKRQPLEIKRLAKDYFAIVTNKRFMSFVTMVSAYFCVFIAWLTIIPFLIIEKLHYTPIMFGVVQAVVFCSYILVSGNVSRVMDKIGIPSMIKLGQLLVLGAGILSVILTAFYPHFLGGLVLSMVIFSGATGFTFAPLNRLSIEASTEPMGARMAINATMFNLFAVIGSILATTFYNGSLYSMSYILLGVAIFVCIIQFGIVRGGLDGVR